MPTTLAQATTSGASNAADFQPGTQNPQSPANTELFSKTDDRQPGSQEVLLENSQAQISVPSNPASGDETAPQPQSSSNGVLIAIILAVILMGLVLWRSRRKKPVMVPKDLEVPEVAIEQVKKAVAKNPRPKAATKKPVPKKSKSQRKKRARR